MKNKGWNEEPSYDIKWLAIIALFVMTWAWIGNSNAKELDEEMYNYAQANGYFAPAMKMEQKAGYGFPPRDVVTMDVLKADGQSGTFLCPSERWCYIKSLEYEARGGEQYCVSLTMKRNGKVVWYRRYQ